jgi:DNA-binding beta-propeller fold protein YncE
MCLPSGLAIDPRNSNLYVSDENNNRVLRFTAPFTAGSSPLPALVLGQSTFAENYPNRTNFCGYSFPSSRSLSGPDQIATDVLGDLYVGDTDNSRVLEYKTPAASGAAASTVYGQLGNFTAEDCDLDTDPPFIGSSTLCFPEGVAADSRTTPSLYIADTQNNRVLWFAAPFTDTDANLVIGQPTFFNQSCNSGASAPSCKTLCGPLTPAVDSLGNLYVPDANNNRVLEYDH